MEEAQVLLERGMEQNNNSKFEDSERTLNEGLSKVESSKNENLEIYLNLLIQRSLSLFMQEKYDKAEEDVNTVLEHCKEDNISDGIKRIKCAAYFRMGQILEMKGRLLLCLREYARSASIFQAKDENDKNQGQESISRLFTEVGLPPISDAPEMAPFLKVSNSILRDDELAEALAESLKFIKQNDFDAVTFSSVGGCRIYMAVIQIYIDVPIILGICVQCLIVLAKKGAKDVWSGYPLIKMAFEKGINNAPLFVLLVQLLELTPLPLFQHMEKLDFIDPLCDGLTLDLTDDQIQSVMHLLFLLGNKDQQLQQIHNEGVTEMCFKKKSSNSFMLLSKLVFIPEACQLALKNGVIDWAIEIISDKTTEKHLILGSLVLLPEAIKKENNPDFEKNSGLAEKIIEAVYHAIMNNTKESEIVAHGFHVADLCLPYAKQKIIDLKYIQASSILLSVHVKDVKASATILEFIFNCCKQLGTEPVKKIPALLPTAMKALSTHSTDPLVLEFGTGIAVYLNHAKKDDLFKAALEIYPKSKILEEMKPLLNKPQSK